MTEHKAIKNRKKIDSEAEKKLNAIISNYERAMSEQINNWYLNYAIDKGISTDEARDIVASFDVASFSDTAREIVQNKDFSNLANEQMRIYNLKMKESRLNLLLEQLRTQALAMYDELEAELYASLNEVANDVYAEQAGVLGVGASVSKETLDTLLYSEYNGESFSSAIWKNKRALVAFLEQEMSTLILSGANPNTLAKKLAELMNVEMYKAKRILRTEGSKLQAEIQRRYYKNNDIERFEFVAERGPRTCKICLGLDGKKFKTSDFEAGKNAQPMHPNCRCTTVPVVE